MPPDISMCENTSCPSKETCYRFKAVPNEYRQSYMEFKVKEGEKKCYHYMKLRKGDIIITNYKPKK